MKYLNASQAAKRIGISDKTIRRWLKEGKISAIRTGSNQLAIPENEVEALRRQRAQFVQHEEDQYTTSHDQSLDILALAAKVATLEQELATLKGTHINPVEQEPMSSISPPLTNDITQESSRSKRSEDIPADAPLGTVKLIEFSQATGIPASTLGRWIRDGKVNAITVQRVSGAGEQHFLVPDEQARAIAINQARIPRKMKKTEQIEEMPVAEGREWYQLDGE